MTSILYMVLTLKSYPTLRCFEASDLLLEFSNRLGRFLLNRLEFLCLGPELCSEVFGSLLGPAKSRDQLVCLFLEAPVGMEGSAW